MTDDDRQRERPRAPGPASAFLLVSAIAALCYANAIRGEFVFDDIKLIVNNDLIKSHTQVSAIFLSNLWDLLGRGSNYYRPLPPLLFMSLHALFGQRPEPFHLVNIALHAGTAGLVFLLARRVLATSGSARAPMVGASLAAAALFATHPIHTEAVAWISGVMDVGCTFFGLLALYTYVVADGGARRPVVYGSSLVALLLGLLCKEPAVVVPLLIVAYDLLFRRDRLTGRAAAGRRWAPVFGVLALYLVLRMIALGGFAPFRHQEATNALGIIRTVPVLLARYLEMLVVPVGLNVVHDIRPVASLLSADFWKAIAILAVVAGITVAAVRAGRRFTFALLLVGLPLLPVLYVPALSQDLSKAFAERYLYFPSVGLSLLVAAVLASLPAAGRRWYAAGLTLTLTVALVFSGMTLSRNLVWRDSYSLWSDCVSKSPGLAAAHENLGLALLRRGRTEEGQRELQAALRLEPELAERSLESAMLAVRKGLFLQAVLELQTALMYRPDLVEARYDLGVLLESRGWNDAAIVEYSRVVAQRPDHAGGHNNLGVLLAQRGRLDEAIGHFEAALRARPDDAEVRSNLARARALAGRAPEPAGAESDRGKSVRR